MPFSHRPAPGDVPGVGDPALDSLLEGKPPAGNTSPGLLTAAAVITALNSAPAASELAAEAGALATFRGAAGMSRKPARSRLWRLPLLGSLLTAKLGSAIAVAAVTLGGGAVAAAYTGALPDSIQQVAHNTIGAPAARPTPTATPRGPDATGHSAYGLCTAYAHIKADGTAAQKAVAFRNLAAAAGGAANVTAYCAGIPHPGATSGGKPSSHPTGKPTSLPAQAPASHPTGKPTGNPGSGH